MAARILVIDDERSITVTFERFIRDAGYEVETARSYREGMSKISEQDFDLIFADIILGGETGLDILRGTNERGLKCPLVLITGYPKVETAALAVRLGAFDYLCKPVHKDTLLSVTKLALLHKSMIEANEKYRSNLHAIFNTVKDAMLMVDKDLVVAEINEAAKELLGLSRGDVGKPIGSVLKGANGRCSNALEEALRKKVPVELRRIECQFANRPRRVLNVTASPIFHPKGTLSGVVLVAKDETRLVDLERNLDERRRYHNIVGMHEKMREIYSLVDDLADVRTSVLITGESGTGKELLAEAIHCRGERKGKPLVKVNCSALSESLLESELFGHVRGAFTGAVKDRIGRFQMADGGTILLDEIGDISPAVQQRLLRVLQESEFDRVGDSTPTRVDVRVIAATNKDLRRKVKLGEFREDLYYRLKVVEIRLPPLRERLDDIPLLAAHFVDKLNSKLHKEIDAVSDDVLRVFMNYRWPGNVRQLAHTLEHAFILCRRNVITLDDLPLELKQTVRQTEVSPVATDRRIRERESIVSVLERTAGNKAMAARLLGISRRTIHRKIAEHGIMNHENEILCDMSR
jgi:two-component system, NtrC family, response regulator HydG